MAVSTSLSEIVEALVQHAYIVPIGVLGLVLLQRIVGPAEGE